MIHLPKNRYHAFGIHLLCSIIVGLLALAIVFRLWYPSLLASALDVTEIFVILLLVDLCLGPLLTLVVFNLEKPELKRDLIIICMLQVSALGYGLYTVAMARPAFILFEVDRFVVTLAKDLDAYELAQANNAEFKSLPWLGPIWGGTEFPEDIDERNALTLESINGGKDLGQIPKYYVAYSESKNKIIEKLKPLNKLATFNPSKQDKVSEILNEYANQMDNIGYLPLVGKSMDLTVIVNKNDARPIELLNLNPW